MISCLFERLCLREAGIDYPWKGIGYLIMPLALNRNLARNRTKITKEEKV